MILKIKETTEREIELSFPSFYKIEETYGKTKYFAFFGEKLGLFVTEGFTYETTPTGFNFSIEKAIPCTKEEVEKVFKHNQKLFSNIMKGINQVTGNDNLPTEVLQKL